MATMEGKNTAQQTHSAKHGFDPIFPITDMGRSIRHYEALGFEVQRYDEEYAFATLPVHGCIHLALQKEHYDPKVSAAAAYLHVEDADELASKWRAGCPHGDTRDPVNTDYGLREGAHLDPDNNLIRFGSRMRPS